MSFLWIVGLLAMSSIISAAFGGSVGNPFSHPSVLRSLRSLTRQETLARELGRWQGRSRRPLGKDRERRDTLALRNDACEEYCSFEANDFTVSTGNGSEYEEFKNVPFASGTLLRRSTAEVKSSESFFSSVRVLMESVIELVTKNHYLIIFHDSHPHTMDDLDHLLYGKVSVPLILLDMANLDLPERPFLGDYNDGFDIHILFFRNIEVVKEFADSLPERIWAPSHLLFVNANLTSNAGPLLEHKSFSHSPFLTLLQRDLRMESNSKFLILTHESFRAESKVVGRGIYWLHGDAPSFDALFPDRFVSFYGYHFHLSSWVDDFPYTVEGETLEDAYGMCIYMLNAIAERLNFTYQVPGWVATSFPCFHYCKIIFSSCSLYPTGYQILVHLPLFETINHLINS